MVAGEGARARTAVRQRVRHCQGRDGHRSQEQLLLDVPGWQDWKLVWSKGELWVEREKSAGSGAAVEELRFLESTGEGGLLVCPLLVQVGAVAWCAGDSIAACAPSEMRRC